MVVLLEGFHFCLSINDHGNAYDLISMLIEHLSELGELALG
jgi:hypothetical protein